MSVKTLFDVPLNSIFHYDNSVYRLLEQKDDTAKAVCIARRTSAGKWFVVTNSHEENFNPYAEITQGKLTLIWEPAA